MGNRREFLEKEIEMINNKIENAPEDTPKEILDAWREEYDELSFELNNLYDDEEND
ncbi:MAG: hypothetical protein LBQ60_20595 [Bacteroidales bacterium]|jgi:hypothetical protein|nr:hypothetical protein [Bacteroidales bacterium]